MGSRGLALRQVSEPTVHSLQCSVQRLIFFFLTVVCPCSDPDSDERCRRYDRWHEDGKWYDELKMVRSRYSVREGQMKFEGANE